MRNKVDELTRGEFLCMLEVINDDVCVLDKSVGGHFCIFVVEFIFKLNKYKK